jgi:deazaflavin-dependent oxidoreductase (nitroreductase family)
MAPKLSVIFDRVIGRRFYKIHRFVYQWTRGFIGHWSPAGPMLLLTTTGRKSGQRRTTPLLYMPDGPRFVVVGSNGGREQPPAWVLNLATTPEAELQVGRRKVHVDASILSSEEKAAVWPRLLEQYPSWGNYQTLTDREIRVVSFAPRTEKDGPTR